MVNLVPNFFEKAWDIWNIRGLVLISLVLQVFLFLFSPLRKRTRTRIVYRSLWLAYLIADYVATFCIGLIFENRQNISPGSVKNYNLVFWAPFLLLHLGGPDTITAFALEDNELWRRHLLGLVFQGITVVYVFLLTIPGNTLWIPTILVFIAGMIKYIERILSLHLASMDTLRKSTGPKKSNASPGFADLFEKSSGHDPDVELVKIGFQCFNKFKGLVVDETYSFGDRNKCRKFFLSSSTTTEDALVVIEAELSFMYEFFFTKVTALHCKTGYFLRSASVSSIVAAFLVFFSISDKKQHGFSLFEVKATYVLFSGAMALDIVALLMLVFSDRTAIFCDSRSHVFLKPLLKLKKPKWSNYKKEPYTKFNAFSTAPLFRRWRGTIPMHDFMTQCIHKINEKLYAGIRWRGVVMIPPYALCKVVYCVLMHVRKWKPKAENPFLIELWEFIFSELQRKSTIAGEDEKIVKRICEARGAWTIQEESKLDQRSISSLLAYVNSDEIAFDESLIVWHIATNLRYYSEEGNDNASDHRYFSKLLSDYMLHLLVRDPSLMSAVPRVGQKRILEMMINLEDISNEVYERLVLEVCCDYVCDFLWCKPPFILEDSPASYKKITEAFYRVKDRELRSDGCKLADECKLLSDGCKLAKKLKALPEMKKWEITAQVWVEMMSFAAINCRPDAHVQQLSKGGQLLSLVWLLTIHFGLASPQFQLQKTDKDHPRMDEEEQLPDTHEAVALEITSIP